MNFLTELLINQAVHTSRFSDSPRLRDQMARPSKFWLRGTWRCRFFWWEWYDVHPREINMEPKRLMVRRCFSFSKGVFSGSHVSFRGCILLLSKPGQFYSNLDFPHSNCQMSSQLLFFALHKPRNPIWRAAAKETQQDLAATSRM